MIEITSYGDNGDLPKINTNGKGVWYQDYGNELDFGLVTYIKATFLPQFFFMTLKIYLLKILK